MSTAIDVNLLSARSNELRKQQIFQTKIKFVTIFSLVCFLGFVVLVLGVSTAVNLKLDRIREDVRQEEVKIGQLAFVEDTYLLLQNRVALLEEFFNLEGEVMDGLDYLVANVPEGLVVEGMELNNQDKTIVWLLTAPTYERLNSFVDFISQSVAAEVFDKVEMTGINRDENGGYAAQVAMSYQL